MEFNLCVPWSTLYSRVVCWVSNFWIFICILALCGVIASWSRFHQLNFLILFLGTWYTVLQSWWRSVLWSIMTTLTNFAFLLTTNWSYSTDPSFPFGFFTFQHSAQLSCWPRNHIFQIYFYWYLIFCKTLYVIVNNIICIQWLFFLLQYCVNIIFCTEDFMANGK